MRETVADNDGDDDEFEELEELRKGDRATCAHREVTMRTRRGGSFSTQGMVRGVCVCVCVCLLLRVALERNINIDDGNVKCSRNRRLSIFLVLSFS